MKKAIVILLITSNIMLLSCNNNATAQNYNTSQSIEQQQAIKNNNITIQEELSKLANAKTIKITTDIVSLNSGHTVYIDDEKFGTISGKYVNVTGDKFTLKSKDGTILASEKQIKRWNVKLNRMAEVYNFEGNVVGYIGEEKIKDMFKYGYVFHFYDKNKNEIGYTNKQFISLMDTYKIFNMSDELCYEVKENFNLIQDSYDIEVINSNDIPAEQAVFFTSIVNAIRNADTSKKSNKNNKKNKG